MSSPSLPPADAQLLETEDFALEQFWQKYRNSVLIGVAVTLVAVVVVLVWAVNSRNTRLAAETLFAKSDDTASWQKVISQFPDSVQAAGARLLVANAQREAGDLTASSASYEELLTTRPEHLLAGTARLGLAENLDVEGQTEAALTALRDVQAKDADSYVAPYAAFLEGNIALREGRLEDARKVFSSLVATYPSSPVRRLAGAQLDELTPFLPPAETAAQAQ